MPSSVTELESYAFSDCDRLLRLTLPANGSLLGELMLSGCGNVEEIYEPSRIVPKFDCESFIFEPDEGERYATVTLRVAPGMARLYRKAPGWCLFDHIIE